MEEMVASENGQIQPAGKKIDRHTLPDVKAISKHVGMKLAEFAEVVGVSAFNRP
ncbi:hypothetical protein ACLB1R_01890 [Escherichia coli]